MFNFPLVEGDKATVLRYPRSVVISETEAKKIFGSKKAMGEIIRIEPFGNMLITGVFKDIPENSHMQFGAISSYATLISQNGALMLEKQEDWKSFLNSFVYILLREDARPRNIEEALNKIAKQSYTQPGFKASFKLQRLDRIVPGPEISNGIGPAWPYLSIFLVGSITLIILIPACANYVNLSISQSLERMREIGVRKVLGGQKKHIFLMFIVESVLVSLLALVVSF